MIYPIARYTLLPFIRFFIKKTVGLENVPKKGPYILACKHLGALDGFFINAVVAPRVNQKVHFIASYQKWGWFWEKIITERWAGCIKFDISNRSKCLEIACEFLRKGEIIGIFPEGYLHEYNQDKKPRTGAARLALWAKVPIVPVGMFSNITVKNDLQVLYQIWKALINTLFNPRSLEIHIGQPFEIEEYYNKKVTRELLREATNNIMNKIKRLTKVDNINQ